MLITDVPSAQSIPYYDLTIAAGSFSDVQQHGKARYVEAAGAYDPERYFACTVVGESMNKIIPNGSICIFERYQGGSRNGLISAQYPMYGDPTMQSIRIDPKMM